MRWVLFLILVCSFALAQPIDFCNGCSYQGKCVSYNSQVSSPTGMLYCEEDSKLYPVKPDSSPCSANYECSSFLCSSGVCQGAEAELMEVSTKSPMLLPSIIFGSLFFLALLFFLVKYILKSRVAKPSKKVKASTKQQPSAMPSVVRIVPVKKKYGQFEKLEKQLEETTKKLSRK